MHTPYKILGDNPVRSKQDDLLGFSSFIAPLAQRIIDSQNNSPFTVGIIAEWGTGKTTILALLQEALEKQGAVTLWFEPWRYKTEESVWKGLVSTLVRGVKKNDSLLKEVKRKRKIWERDLTKVLYEAVFGKLGGNFIDVISKEPWAPEHLHVLEESIENLISLNSSEKPLVLFIDDLDRCMPTTTLTVLSAIKLILNKKNLITVMALSEKEVVASVHAAYARELGSSFEDFSPEWAEKYIRKILNYPFFLPTLSNESRIEYTDNCFELSGIKEHLNEGWIPIFEESCDNVREVKWLINRYISEADKTFPNLIVEWNDSKALKLHAPRALLFMLLAHRFPSFFNEILFERSLYFAYQQPSWSEGEIERGVHPEEEISSFFNRCFSHDKPEENLVQKISENEIGFYIQFGTSLRNVTAPLEVITFRDKNGIGHYSEWLKGSKLPQQDSGASILCTSRFSIDGDNDQFISPDAGEQEIAAHQKAYERALEAKKTLVESMIDKR